MKPVDLQQLKRDVKHFHNGKICQSIERILLPFYRYTAHIWVSGESGPRELDQIFFGLLHNGVAVRKDIARRLGVNEDSFLLQHLDHMVSEGYVIVDEEGYQITDIGAQFMDGTYLEDVIEKDKVKFDWNCVGECADEQTDCVRSDNKLFPLEHKKPPTEDMLYNETVKCFNKCESARKFHKVDSASGQRWYSSHKIFREYLACVYVPKKQSDEEWHIDLRIPVSDGNNTKAKPCEALTEKINNDEFWRERFEKICKAGKNKG